MAQLEEDANLRLIEPHHGYLLFHEVRNYRARTHDYNIIWAAVNLLPINIYQNTIYRQVTIVIYGSDGTFISGVSLVSRLFLRLSNKFLKLLFVIRWLLLGHKKAPVSPTRVSVPLGQISSGASGRGSACSGSGPDIGQWWLIGRLARRQNQVISWLEWEDDPECVRKREKSAIETGDNMIDGELLTFF